MLDLPRSEQQLGRWFGCAMQRFGLNNVVSREGEEEAFIFFRLGGHHCFYQLSLSPKGEFAACLLAADLENNRLVVEEYNAYVIEDKLFPLGEERSSRLMTAVLTALMSHGGKCGRGMRRQILFNAVLSQARRLILRRRESTARLGQWETTGRSDSAATELAEVCARCA